MGLFDKKSIAIKEVHQSEFAYRLRRARKAANLSQQEVAEILNKNQRFKSVSQRTVSHWERDKAIPKIDIFVQICKIYGVTPNELLGFDPFHL